jgi:ribosomal protein S18 acetylase RimI-like enzyme
MNSAVPASSPTTTEIALRPATADDEPLLFAIFCEVRGAMFAGLPEPQKDILLRMQFHAQKSGYEQGYPDAERMIVVADGRSVGAVLVQRSTVIWRLVDISLFTAYRNQGIGTRLIRDLLDHAAKSARSLQLQVARDNPAARLYERLGMQMVAEDDVYVTMQSEAPAKKMYAADFVLHVNTHFLLPDGRPLLLERVSEVAPLGPFERFALSFHSEGPIMPQNTFLLKHPSIGEIQIFLVPVAPGTYEALFSVERRIESSCCDK